MSWWRSRRCQQCQDMGREIVRLKTLLSEVAAVLGPLDFLMNDKGRSLLARLNASAYGPVTKQLPVEDLRR